LLSLFATWFIPALQRSPQIVLLLLPISRVLHKHFAVEIFRVLQPQFLEFLAQPPPHWTQPWSCHALPKPEQQPF
jgi:hypothetical protein